MSEQNKNETLSDNKELYLMGRENATIDIVNQIRAWEGETESPLGKLLYDKFNELRKKQIEAWE